MIYILNACLCPDQNWKLIVYPEPAFQSDESQQAPPLLFREHPKSILKSTNIPASHILGILPLHEENPDICETIVPGIDQVLDNWWNAYRISKSKKE